MVKRKALYLGFVVLLMTGFYPASPWAQGFKPSRPVDLVVHSAPGGGSDVFARAVIEMAEKEKLLHQPIRVVNKTAGAGVEAMAYLVEKKGNDHTIAVFTNTWVPRR